MNHTPIVLTLALALLSACAAPAPAPAQPEPAGAAPAPTAASAPTATPAPTTAPAPTATPTEVPPIPTAVPEQAVRAALRATSSLSTYRIHFAVTLRITPEDGPAEEYLYVDFSGAFRGSDVAFQQRSLDMSEPGSRVADGTLSVIIVDGQTYVHGPIPLDGAYQEAWYSFGEYTPAPAQPALGAQNTLDRLFEKIDLVQLQPDGEDTIDGVPCTRYQGGEHVALRFVDSLGTPTTPEAIEREKLPVEQRLREDGIDYRDPDARLWVCDGLLRRIESSLTMIPSDGARTASYALWFEITEPNGDIAIEPPEEWLPVSPGSQPMAEVYNGGNVREQPSLSGRVLDQIHAYERVALHARTADGRWFRITNPRGVTGWVSASLLTVDPATVAAVPVE